METKKDIRKKVFSLRKNSLPHQIQSDSRVITQRILSLPEFSNAERILSYASYRNEVITDYIVEEALKAGKEVALPRVCGEFMQFYHYDRSTRMQKSSMGIEEPEGDTPIIPGRDLMIMPGMAFDRNRNRIGYGGGFYDRYLQKYPQIITIAVAFGFQIFEEIPSEITDIRPQMIITEKEILR